jgi:hypothetical protein
MQAQSPLANRQATPVALEDRWDALRQAEACLAKEDYVGAMKTGVVLLAQALDRRQRRL